MKAGPHSDVAVAFADPDIHGYPERDRTKIGSGGV